MRRSIYADHVHSANKDRYTKLSESCCYCRTSKITAGLRVDSQSDEILQSLWTWMMTWMMSESRNYTIASDTIKTLKYVSFFSNCILLIVSSYCCLSNKATFIQPPALYWNSSHTKSQTSNEHFSILPPWFVLVVSDKFSLTSCTQ